jgi:hypothetical protein
METGFHDGLGTDDDRPENGVAWQLRASGYFTFAAVANSLLGLAQMPVHRAFNDFRQVGDIVSGASSLDMMNDVLRIDARLAFFRVRATAPNQAASTSPPSGCCRRFSSRCARRSGPTSAS